MAYDDYLAERIKTVLKSKKVFFVEKRMMGGLTFMVNNKMCVGVVQDTLMVRIDPEFYSEALTKNGCREMDFTGRPMKGFVIVDPEGIDTGENLQYWIKLALDYNPRAKLSKRKGKA